MSWITLARSANVRGSFHFPLVTAADFRTLVLVAAGELQQIAIERRAKVEEFQRKHRTGLLTLLLPTLSIQLNSSRALETAKRSR